MFCRELYKTLLVLYNSGEITVSRITSPHTGVQNIPFCKTHSEAIFSEHFFAFPLTYSAGCYIIGSWAIPYWCRAIGRLTITPKERCAFRCVSYSSTVELLCQLAEELFSYSPLPVPPRGKRGQPVLCFVLGISDKGATAKQ